MRRATFGKYVLLRKLAIGGMGEVFLAKQTGPSGFEKLLVIKRILAHHTEKHEYLDMFLNEARLVAYLTHGNIIQIHEMGQIEGDYFIAMEYVRGKSLRDLIDVLRQRGQHLPLAHAVELLTKLCDGLGYAHSARDIRGRPMNIIHRDINPHNVLISYNGDLKLIDFGIAKSEMTSVHTATGTIKGKFVYMSPEQSAADPIDRRSDIFSLGIVFYEMLLLENPFVRQNVVLSLEAIQRQRVTAPTVSRPELSDLEPVLLKALEKDPADRYQSCEQMRDDLRALVRAGKIRPADTDLSDFLGGLFADDIAREDRLLLEADQAVSSADDGSSSLPDLESPSTSSSPDQETKAARPQADQVGVRPMNHADDLSVEDEPTLTSDSDSETAAFDCGDLLGPEDVRDESTRDAPAMAQMLVRKGAGTLARSTAFGEPVRATLPPSTQPPPLLSLSSSADSPLEPSISFSGAQPRVRGSMLFAAFMVFFVTTAVGYAVTRLLTTEVIVPQRVQVQPVITPPLRPAPDPPAEPMPASVAEVSVVAERPSTKPRIAVRAPSASPRAPKREPRVERSRPRTRPAKAVKPRKPPPVKKKAVVLGTAYVNASIGAEVQHAGRSVGAAPARFDLSTRRGVIALRSPGLGYTVELAYRMRGDGIEVTADASPWAIAQYGGISLGRTPQGPLSPAVSHHFAFLRPGQSAPFEVFLRYEGVER